MLNADLPLARHWLSMAGWLMTYPGPRGRKRERGKEKKRKSKSRLAKSNQIQISVLNRNAADIEAQG